MKKLSFFLGFIVLFGLFSMTHAQDFVPGQIMIDIKHEYLPITPTPNGENIIETGLPSMDTLNVFYGIYAFEKLCDDWGVSKGFYLLKFPESVDVNQALSSYLEDIHINMGSLNYIRQPFSITPSDSYYTEQWGLPKMQCPDAWMYALGSSSMVIQIIDGGTDYGHPDLVHNIWQNLGEDADGDGHTIEWDAVENEWVLDPGDLNDVNDDWETDTLFGGDLDDDLVGWDFTDWDRDPKPGASWGDHGDKTAGTAAAVTDNRISWQEATHVCDNREGTVAGTSWLSKVMIARVYSDPDAINAIHYGIHKGAKIINMSWGGPDDNPLLHAKLDEAWESGLLLVASAGNYTGEVPQYPASYANVIAVAATDSDDVKEGYSAYGTWVDICAPGENWSPGVWKQWYCYYDWGGTSCSAPFVSGVAALVWACYPESSNAAIRTALINSADDIYSIPGNSAYYGKLGSGRANAYEAVKYYGAEPRPSGDCNGDRLVDVADIVFLINYCFLGGQPPRPLCIGDVTDNGVIDSGDIVYLIEYVHLGGPAPKDGCD